MHPFFAAVHACFVSHSLVTHNHFPSYSFAPSRRSAAVPLQARRAAPIASTKQEEQNETMSIRATLHQRNSATAPQRYRMDTLRTQAAQQTAEESTEGTQ